MVDEFIKLFTGYEGDFGIADMSKTSLDSNKNKIKPNYELKKIRKCYLGKILIKIWQ